MWRFATWPPCSHQHLDLTRNKIYFIALHDLKVSFHQNIEQHSLGPALYHVFPILPWPGSDYCESFVWNWVLTELNHSIKSKYSMPGSVVPLALFLHQFLKVKILILPKKTNLLVKRRIAPSIENLRLNLREANLMFFTLSEIRYRPLIKQSLSFVSLPQHRSEKTERLFVPHFRTK